MRYFACLLLLFLFQTIESQEYRHYTVNDGLPGSDVTAICENEYFLWLATNEGLCRFDGHEFKTYKKGSNSENSLSENNIESLMLDSKGLLWIGLKTGGVDIYDPGKDQFTHISEWIDDYPQRVTCIFEDSQHSIWLGSWRSGLYQLIPSTQPGKRYEVLKHYSGAIISTLAEKPKGYLWIGTYYGCFLYDIHKKCSVETNHNEHTISQFLDRGEKNTLWYSAWTEGIFKVTWNDDLTKIEEKLITTDAGDIYSLASDVNNQILLGTWGRGMRKADLADVEHRGHLTTVPDPQVKALVVESFFRDRYNRLWIGTYGSGLFCFDNERRGIRQISPVNQDNISAVTTIHELGENKMLIGTQGNGLFVCNQKDGKLSPKSMNFAEQMPNLNYIQSLYLDRELLIVGHDHFGFCYAERPYDSGENFRLKPFLADQRLAKVTSIYRDRDSLFWIGTKQNGLISLRYQKSPGGGTFSHITYYNSFGQNDEITGFAQAQDGRLWISTHSGLYLFNPVTQKSESFEGEHVSDMVYRMVDDPQNECLWLGTSTGLKQVDYHDKKVKPYFPANLLPSGAIHTLILDQDNNLWFSIADRMYCLRSQSKKLQELNVSSYGKQVLTCAGMVDEDGKRVIAFGGTDRLLLVEPSAVLNRSQETQLLLTGLEINHQQVKVGDEIAGKVVLNKATEYTQALTLPYQSKWISLSFKEIGLGNYRNKYQYFIEGFSDNWQYIDIDKPITFSQLQPGKYILWIRQIGAENSTPCYHLNMTILPPWWQTVWFNTIEVFFVLLLLVLAVFYIRNYYRKRQLERTSIIEKRKKEELLQEKESFFISLSHDLMTPFSLIIAPVNDLLRKKDLPEDMQDKLGIIGKNANFLSDIFTTILDYKRTVAVNVELKEKHVELVSFIRIVVNSFAYIAQTKGVQLAFQTELSRLEVLVDSVKLERIMYNLLSNAMKFTPAQGRVEVRLFQENAESYTFEISDTGSGIAPQNLDKVFGKFYQEAKPEEEGMKGLGLGLYIVKKFVKALNGTVHVDSELNKGTTFQVQFPLKRSEELISIEESDEVGVELDDNPTIVIVEDNVQLCDYLKKEFSNYFRVIVAPNGQEALNVIQRVLPEVVISDVMMPEMDGLTLCEKIKQTPLLSDIFVILLSAKSSPEDELAGYKAGADFYLKKPFDMEILINHVMNVYETRKKRKKQIITELFSPQKDSSEVDAKDDFLRKAVKVIEEHLMDDNFKIDNFAAEMNVSKTVLHRKFKMLIGDTPNVFIRNIRLYKAAHLLKTTDLTIAEIAYLTGFNLSHYFIKCFKEQYNETPNNFRKRMEKES